MRLQSVRVRSFKAIVDSRVVKLGPLTVFIGNNGAGKSSLIEALQTYQAIVRDGLDKAMQRWLGIEHARHKGGKGRDRAGERGYLMQFELTIGDGPRKNARRLEMTVSDDAASNAMGITAERISKLDGTWVSRDPVGADQSYGSGRSILSAPLPDYAAQANHVQEWQFLTMSPDRMGMPVPQQRTEGGVRLLPDASNIADFLRDLRARDSDAFDGIVTTMAYVLPYAKDIQPSLTSELERKAWLQLSEADYKVPGWLFSSGTLRMLALLALLRHPAPPPLILIEEIENGLDPRSVHLIIEEIRTAVLSGITQVVATTHSPYLLDLLTLDHLIVVERDKQGHACFLRPEDTANLQRWSEEFAPGRLYTMGRLSGLAK